MAFQKVCCVATAVWQFHCIRFPALFSQWSQVFLSIHSSILPPRGRWCLGGRLLGKQESNPRQSQHDRQNGCSEYFAHEFSFACVRIKYARDSTALENARHE